MSPDLLRFTGSVPSLAHRHAIVSALERARQPLTINHIQIDRLRTETQLATVAQLLPELAPILASGTIRLEESQLIIHGTIASEDARDQIQKLLQASKWSQLPSDLKLAVAPDSSPPWLQADFAPESLRISGLLPGNTDRERLQASLLQSPTPPTAFAVQAAAGVPQAGAAALASLPLSPVLEDLSPILMAGSLRLEPDRAILNGQVKDLPSKLNATRILKSFLGREIRIENHLLISTQPLPPSTAIIASLPAPPESPIPPRKKPAPEPEPRKVPTPPSGEPTAPPTSMKEAKQEVAMTTAAPPDEASPQPEATPSPVPSIPAPASTTSPRFLFFNVGSTWITPASRKSIEASAADFKKRSAGSRILLRSHPDGEGDPDINRILSRKRSEEVKSTLVKLGVPSSRINVEDITETTAALAAADDPSRERRVDIVLIP